MLFVRLVSGFFSIFFLVLSRLFQRQIEFTCAAFVMHLLVVVFFTMNKPIKTIDANSFVLFIFEYVRDYVVRYVVGDAQLISRIACELFSRVILAIDRWQTGEVGQFIVDFLIIFFFTCFIITKNCVFGVNPRTVVIKHSHKCWLIELLFRVGSN